LINLSSLPDSYEDNNGGRVNEDLIGSLVDASTKREIDSVCGPQLRRGFQQRFGFRKARRSMPTACAWTHIRSV